MALQTVGIVGAGAWGTALGVSARRAGRDVLIWAYEPETIAEINEQHRNSLYLPGVGSRSRHRGDGQFKRGRHLRRDADGHAGAELARHRR